MNNSSYTKYTPETRSTGFDQLESTGDRGSHVLADELDVNFLTPREQVVAAATTSRQEVDLATTTNEQQIWPPVNEPVKEIEPEPVFTAETQEPSPKIVLPQIARTPVPDATATRIKELRAAIGAISQKRTQAEHAGIAIEQQTYYHNLAEITKQKVQLKPNTSMDALSANDERAKMVEQGRLLFENKSVAAAMLARQTPSVHVPRLNYDRSVNRLLRRAMEKAEAMAKRQARENRENNRHPTSCGPYATLHVHSETAVDQNLGFARAA